MNNYILVYVSFANKEQAQIIIKTLLENRLIACAKFSEIQSHYWWNNEIETDNEILATLETREDKFEEIERVIKSMHTYDQLSMFAVPITSLANGVSHWIDETLGKSNLQKEIDLAKKEIIEGKRKLLKTPEDIDEYINNI